MSPTPQKPDRLIPEIFVNDGVGAMKFYQRAFAATEVSRMLSDDGKKLLHGELTILGHLLYVCDEFTAQEGGTCKSPRTLGGTPARMMLQVDDADATFARAVKAGAEVMMPLEDMFWGARYGKLKDPYGHEWGINQQNARPTQTEEVAAAKTYFAKKKKPATKKKT